MANRLALVSSIALVSSGPVFAQAETTSFTYDSLGRVVEVESARSAETIDFDYSYDRADNRTQEVVTEQTTAAIEGAEDVLAFDASIVEGIPDDVGMPRQ